MALGTILAGIGAAGSLAQGISALTDDGPDIDVGGGPNRGSRLRELFESRVDRLRDQNAAQSATFRAGVGALQEQTEAQAERDESAAAARGLTGSAFEVAQDANRAEALGGETRRLLVDAERQQEERRQSALSNLVRSAGLEEDIRARRQQAQLQRAEMEQRRKGRLGQIAGSALQAGATIFASGGGGGG